MSIQATSDNWASINAGVSINAGGLSGIGVSAIGTGTTITLNTYTCLSCGTVITQGMYHVCGGLSNLPNCFPSGSTIPVFLPHECAFCDKILEMDDKKLCKECRGVFEAWKFLTTREEPEGEKEP